MVWFSVVDSLASYLLVAFSLVSLSLTYFVVDFWFILHVIVIFIAILFDLEFSKRVQNML